jgi:hypothetical protein
VYCTHICSQQFNLINRSIEKYDLNISFVKVGWLVLRCLTPLSTIFQLYRLLMLWVRIPRLATGRWFSPGTPVASTNWPPRYNWNIVESGVKHLKTNQPTFTKDILRSYFKGKVKTHNIVYHFIFQVKCMPIYGTVATARTFQLLTFHSLHIWNQNSTIQFVSKRVRTIDKMIHICAGECIHPLSICGPLQKSPVLHSVIQ